MTATPPRIFAGSTDFTAARFGEEIVQDVFLQLWRNAKRYQAARGPLEPWLFTVARNRLSISSA